MLYFIPYAFVTYFSYIQRDVSFRARDTKCFPFPSHPTPIQSRDHRTWRRRGGRSDVLLSHAAKQKKKKKKNSSLQTYPFRGKKKGPAKKKPKTRKRRKGEQSRHKNETQHYWDKVNTIIKKHKKMEDGKQKQKWKQKWK